MVQSNDVDSLPVDDIYEDAVQVKEARVFFQRAPDLLRVYFIYEFFWFCMEGEASGADRDVNISNIRARGSFVDHDGAMDSIPEALQKPIARLIAGKRFLKFT